MRILFLSYLHPRVTPGGSQQVAYELFKASRAAGHDSYMLAALEIEHEGAFGKPGAPIVPLHGEDRQFFYFPQNYDFLHLSVSDDRSTRFLREFIERIDPDVVHVHHYHRVGVEAIRAARVAAPRATICLTLHEMMAICLADGQMVRRNTRALCPAATPLDCNRCFPDLRPEFFTLRRARLLSMLGECDAFISPSVFLAERYVEWGLPNEKCYVIPNGQIDESGDFDKTQHSKAVNRFGFFGQMLDNKGVDVVLEAIAILCREKRLPPSGIVFEINGGNQHYATAAYKEKIARQMEELRGLNVGPLQITERGIYRRDQIAERMRDIDWVIAPSTWWEVFGLVVSEAWMFGRPVLASNIAGLGERIQDGVNGFKFTPRDARSLADLIASLIGDEARWLKVNSTIEQPWSEVDMLDAHVALWTELRGGDAAGVEDDARLLSAEV